MEETRMENASQQIFPKILLRRWKGPSTIRHKSYTPDSSDEEFTGGIEECISLVTDSSDEESTGGIQECISLVTDSDSSQKSAEEPTDKQLCEKDKAKMLTGNPLPSKILKAFKSEKGITFYISCVDGGKELGIYETLYEFLKLNHPYLLIEFYEHHIEWDNSEVNSPIRIDSSPDTIIVTSDDE